MKTYKDRVAMIADLPEGSLGVEIGVQRGDFAAVMLATGKVSKLLLIDPWREFPTEEYNDPANISQQHQDTLAAYVEMRFHDRPEVTIMRMTSMEAYFELWAKPVEPQFAFAFVDGNHSYSHVGMDLVLWSKWTRCIMCHDYVENDQSRALGFGVKAAVDKWLEQNPEWKITAVTSEEWATCKLEKV